MKMQKLFPNNPVYTKPEFYKINPKSLSKLTYRYGELNRQKGYVICGDTVYIYHRNLLAAEAKRINSKIEIKFYLKWLEREAVALIASLSSLLPPSNTQEVHPWDIENLTEEEWYSMY